jgi:ribonuclease HI
VNSANEAEMAAIFAAIYLARKAWGAAVRGLVVYTDSQAAVGFLSGEALRARTQQNAPGIARLRERIRALSGEYGIELDLRWIKGHQRTNTVRAYLNARCDQLAGAARAMAERGGGKERRAVAEKSTKRPNASERVAPAAEGPRRRSRKQKNRERRLRARERKRAKKAARVHAPARTTDR